MKSYICKMAFVSFPQYPVKSISRPCTRAEFWSFYVYETHARSCNYCCCPCQYTHEKHLLCSIGSRLFNSMLEWIYRGNDGRAYSVEESLIPIHVEVPISFYAVYGALHLKQRDSYVCLCGYISMEKSASRFAKTRTLQHIQYCTDHDRPNTCIPQLLSRRKHSKHFRKFWDRFMQAMPRLSLSRKGYQALRE